METYDFKKTVEKRLKFIEARLFWEGSISRGDIVNFFKISKPQATNDLVEYRNLYRDKTGSDLKYNNKLKHFEKPDNFKPFLSGQTSEGYLNRLLFLRRRSDDCFFCGILPPNAKVPILARFINESFLKAVLNAIRDKLAINIEYQSKKRPEPISRWITPHSLGHDGFRWHVRALCHINKDYRDFVLSRILSVGKSQKHLFDHSLDYKWHQDLELVISADDQLELGKRRATELEYGIEENGERRIQTKAVFYFYLERQYPFIGGKRDDELDRLILKNKSELETQIDLLESMSKDRIEEIFNFSPK